MAPTGQSYALTNSTNGFYLASPSGDPVEFVQSAPKGIYRFTAFGTSGYGDTKKLTLPPPVTGLLPMRIANLSDMQGMDPNVTFDVAWDKVHLPSGMNYVTLQIYGPDGSLAYGDQQVPVVGRSVIPIWTLEPNTTYSGYLSLVHFFSHSSRLAKPAWATVEKHTTRFQFRTKNPAGVFEFSSLCVLADKSSGSATFTVNRTEGVQGNVTVDYFTTDGTARSNTNYLPVSGTLSFDDDRDEQRTITVPLLNDGLTNPPLTVHLTLTNATGGASLPEVPHATLTILDSQAPVRQDINACLLAKVEFYSQTDTAPPTQSPLAVASRFYASVHPKFPGACIGATLKIPGGGLRSLAPLHQNYQDFVEFNDDFPSPASMNSTYRGGKYKLTVETLWQGNFSTTMSLGVERKFSVPQLLNWDKAQSIDSTQPFALGWNPFVEAGTNDMILVGVTDESGEDIVRTPDELEPGVLPGSTQSYTISPNTLAPGKRYFAYVIFVKLAGVGTEPASAVFVGTDPASSVKTGIVFVHTTSFYIQTMPAPSL
jgi:hypothetical protein